MPGTESNPASVSAPPAYSVLGRDSDDLGDSSFGITATSAAVPLRPLLPPLLPTQPDFQELALLDEKKQPRCSSVSPRISR